MTLGILDWGIGGIGFYAAFSSRFPEVRVVYLSDAGCVPYGKMTARDLRRRLGVVGPAFARAGVTSLVVACNAMSTVLPNDAAELGLERLCGVVESGVGAVLEADVGLVGVVGGVRTIRSGTYGRPLRAAGLAVRQRVAQPLSALVEAGLTSSPAFRLETGRVMAPLAGVDALVLGCTHYTAGVSRFRELAGAALIVDPATETLDRVVAHWLAGRPEAERDDGELADVFLTTGDPAAMTRAARLAFGVTLTPVRRVALDLGEVQCEGGWPACAV